MIELYNCKLNSILTNKLYKDDMNYYFISSISTLNFKYLRD